MNEELYGLLGVLFGGAGLKLAERFINKPDRVEDKLDKNHQRISAESTKLREELWKEVIYLRESCATMLKDIREVERVAEEELDVWKSKYYTLMEDFQALKLEKDQLVLRVIALEQRERQRNPGVKQRLDDPENKILIEEVLDGSSTGTNSNGIG